MTLTQRYSNIKRGLLSLLLLVSPILVAGNPLPDLGDQSGAIISPYEERQLGEGVMRQARQNLTFINDPELLSYLQSLGGRIATRSEGAQETYQFFLVDDSAINAFAVPGGFITVHTGLIKMAESEAELASVLAHEIAHISQRHIPRIMAAQQNTGGQTMLALLAAIMLAQAGEYEAGEAALALTAASLTQKSINFTRSHEEEADRVGTQLLIKSGYSAHAMPQFFKRLMNWGRIYETNLPEFLRTHPLTNRRITEAEDRAAPYPDTPAKPSSDFHHFKAKIRAITEEQPGQAVAVFADNLKNKRYKIETAERYGYTLALLRAKRFDAARKQISPLRTRYPERVQYAVVQAEIEMAARNYDKALAYYATALERHPSHPGLLQSYANALLKTGKPTMAYKISKQAIRQQPDNPALYKILATAAGETGKKLEAHQALAEHYYLGGNRQSAIQQLEIASRYAGKNDYLQASLSARIKELQEESKRLQQH
ncbi:MAG: M48 family metallopeptidase [Gammaproteobacteria bacterium]|nr:MAG: M48 family metallopeptidase [Gammaproteobacteria bacterium]